MEEEQCDDLQDEDSGAGHVLDHSPDSTDS